MTIENEVEPACLKNNISIYEDDSKASKNRAYKFAAATAASAVLTYLTQDSGWQILPVLSTVISAYGIYENIANHISSRKIVKESRKRLEDLK